LPILPIYGTSEVGMESGVLPHKRLCVIFGKKLSTNYREYQPQTSVGVHRISQNVRTKAPVIG